MKFEDLYKLPTTAMRINRSHPAIRRDTFWVVQFTVITIYIVSCFCLLCYSIFFHDIRNKKYTEASKNGIIAIVAFTIYFKYSILLYHQKSISHLMQIIDEDYSECERTFNKDEKAIVMKHVRRSVLLCRLWLVLAISTSFIFAGKALALMGYYYLSGEFQLIPMFDFTFPSFIEPYKSFLPIYCVIFITCLLFACCSSTMYLGFEPLVPIFLSHFSGQLEVANSRIGKILSDNTNERQILEKFKLVAIMLQKIYRFTDCVNENFTVLYEFVLKTTTFLVPLSAYQMVECVRNRDTNIEFIPFFFASLVLFYIPCHYSDMLMETSESLRQAIYSCGWEKHSSMRMRSTVLYMLTRCSKPLAISTIFYPLCLNTFAKMCHNAYAIFNILNATWLQ